MPATDWGWLITPDELRGRILEETPDLLVDSRICMLSYSPVLWLQLNPGIYRPTVNLNSVYNGTALLNLLQCIAEAVRAAGIVAIGQDQQCDSLKGFDR
jgi:hypothetical protein